MTSTLRQKQLAQNDRELRERMADIASIGRGFGLAMMGSAQILSDSAAMIAKLAIEDNQDRWRSAPGETLDRE